MNQNHNHKTPHSAHTAHDVISIPSPNFKITKAVIKRWQLDILHTSPATREQYAGRLYRFDYWCKEVGKSSAPASPETVSAYIEWRSHDVQTDTLKSDVRAISIGHDCRGYDNPTRHTSVRRVAGYKSFQDTKTHPESNGVDIIPLHAAKNSIAGESVGTDLTLTEIDDLSDDIKLHTLSANTMEAYADRLKAFSLFCRKHDLCPLPASVDTVVRFLTEYGLTRKPATLSQARAAIRYIHIQHDAFPIPTDARAVKEVLQGHTRLVGTAKSQKTPLTSDDIIRLCAKIDEEGGALAIRDKAMFLLGFTGAFRRSEMTKRKDHKGAPEIFLAIEDISFTRYGVNVNIRKSKTDQSGDGECVFINYAPNPAVCAVLALQEWLDFLKTRKITSGALFRGMSRVGDITKGNAHIKNTAMDPQNYVLRLKLWCEHIGINPDEIGGHSLRSGHVTTAGINGASPFSVAKQGRWKSLDTVLTYYRKATPHQDNSSSKLWED